MIRALVRAGADVAARNKKGSAPMDFARAASTGVNNKNVPRSAAATAACVEAASPPATSLPPRVRVQTPNLHLSPPVRPCARHRR